MKKLLTGLFLLTTLTLARADFTSYTLVSQSNTLQYDPVVSFTFDTLSINFTGNSGGNANMYTSGNAGAVVTLSFTDNQSIIGDSVQLAWIYPSAGAVFEYFPSIIVPGTVNLGFGASDFVVTGNTITINNDTNGWSGSTFNGFVLTDLTRQAAGPSNTVPDATSTLPLLAAAMAGLAICRRAKTFARR